MVENKKNIKDNENITSEKDLTLQIIQLLTEIKDLATEINEKMEGMAKEEEEKEWQCDGCESWDVGAVSKQVNKFTFCSEDCYNEWAEEKEDE